MLIWRIYGITLSYGSELEGLRLKAKYTPYLTIMHFHLYCILDIVCVSKLTIAMLVNAKENDSSVQVNSIVVKRVEYILAVLSHGEWKIFLGCISLKVEKLNLSTILYKTVVFCNVMWWCEYDCYYFVSAGRHSLYNLDYLKHVQHHRPGLRTSSAWDRG